MVPENNYQIINTGPHAKNLHQPFKLSSSSTLADDLSDLSDINDLDSLDAAIDQTVFESLPTGVSEDDAKELLPLDPECVCFVFVHVSDLEAQFPFYEQLKAEKCAPFVIDSDVVLDITQYHS